MFVHISSYTYTHKYTYNVIIYLPSASPLTIERWPQGSLMCILGGSQRESRREKKEKKKMNKKGRRRSSHKTEAAFVARFAVTTY
jgi:hypothetical protein